MNSIHRKVFTDKHVTWHSMYLEMVVSNQNYISEEIEEQIKLGKCLLLASSQSFIFPCPFYKPKD
jgi:hypothetical protein